MHLATAKFDRNQKFPAHLKLQPPTLKTEAELVLLKARRQAQRQRLATRCSKAKGARCALVPQGLAAI